MPAAAANSAIISSLLMNFGIELLHIKVPQGVRGGFIALLVSLILFFRKPFLFKPPFLDSNIAVLMDR